VGDTCNSKFGYVQGLTSKNKIYVGEHVHVYICICIYMYMYIYELLKLLYYGIFFLGETKV